MKYFGIKTPDKEHSPSYIWWITDREHESWNIFFRDPNKYGEINPHRLPLSEAIEAYKGIGYKCVELELKEKKIKSSIKEDCAVFHYNNENDG